MAIKLGQLFFERPALEVAPELLGKFLVRSIDGQETRLMINEVEAYVGSYDLACHARVGMTKRNASLFGPAGHFYVYLVYGMHWMLNIVTDYEGYPSGVLIRGAGKFCGPARVTKALQIDKSFNGLPVNPLTGLWIQDAGIAVELGDIQKAPRIGVAYAGPIWSQVPYRFILKNLRCSQN